MSSSPKSLSPTSDAPPQPDWAALNAEWEAGKESQSDFCKRNNLNRHTFAYWRARFVFKRKGKPQSSFIPLKVKAEIPTSKPLIIESLSGLKLIISGDAPLSYLSEILKLVGFINA